MQRHANTTGRSTPRALIMFPVCYLLAFLSSVKLLVYVVFASSSPAVLVLLSVTLNAVASCPLVIISYEYCNRINICAISVIALHRIKS